MERIYEPEIWDAKVGKKSCEGIIDAVDNNSATIEDGFDPVLWANEQITKYGYIK